MRCVDCHSEVVLIGGTVWACWACFARHTAEQNVENLITRAQLGILREPITQRQLEAA